MYIQKQLNQYNRKDENQPTDLKKAQRKSLNFIFDSENAAHQADLYKAHPIKSDIKEMYNQLEKDAGAHLIKAVFPSIKYKREIFVSRSSFQTLTDQFLQDLQQKRFIAYFPGLVKYDKSLLKKDPNQEQIRILILCHQYMPSRIEEPPFQLIKSDKFEESIIIHIHGGGFTSMSPHSHQMYSRKYSMETNCPLFSIDYAKAPERAYPEGLNDCWQAYLHILQICEQVYGFKPKRVVLTGDSAGGNLIASLSLLSIMCQVRIPDGIMMSYPALFLNSTYYTPRNLISLDDILLPYYFLKAILEQYLGENLQKTENSCFVHPILADDEVLKQFPQSRIIVGDQDALVDGSLIFTQKLANLQKDHKIYIFKGFTHGFLQFDHPFGVSAAKDCINFSVKLLKQLLKI